MLQDLIANLALLTTFLFLTSRISRRQETTIDSTVRAKVQIGVVNGVFGILLMYFSVRIDTDTILDFRQIVIIAAAHFGGLYASIISGAIIALGRISLFGGLNKSSLTATSAALVVGLSSGLLAYYVQPYWKKWFLSILVSILVTTGSLFWLLDFVSAIKILPYFTGIILAGGLFVAYLIRYLSEANRLMLRLEQSESRYRRLYYLNEAIFQSATEVAIMTTDNEGRFTRFNSGAEQMFGYSAEEVIGIHTPALFHWSVDTTEHTGAGPQPADPLNEEEMLISMARQGIPQDREWTYVTKRGEKVQVHLIVSPVKENGYDIAGFLLVATDITHKKQAEARLLEANRMLQKLSLLDGLTQIPNRRAMDETLEGWWKEAERRSLPMSMILLDIDYFKSYNDNYGHLGGDQCLKQVAAAIQGTLGQSELAARYGGEEFAVVLPSQTSEQAVELAEKIRQGVERLQIRHIGSKSSEWVTVSLGVATLVPYTGRRPQELIALADKSLYRAKREGRNRVGRYGG